MCEQVFGSGGAGGAGGGPLSDARATVLAAGLAERALDEIARAGHDWGLIGELARRLAAVAERVRAPE